MKTVQAAASKFFRDTRNEQAIHAFGSAACAVAALDIAGPLSLTALQRSVSGLLADCDGRCTDVSSNMAEGQNMNAPYGVQHIDLSSDVDPEKTLERLLEEWPLTGSQPISGLPHISVLKLDINRHILVLTSTAHTSSHGAPKWLIREVGTRYRELTGQIPADTFDCQSDSYENSGSRMTSHAERSTAVWSWNDQFNGLEYLTLPVTSLKEAFVTTAIGRHVQSLTSEMSDQVSRLASEEHVEAATVYLCALVMLLARYSRENDIAVRTRLDGIQEVTRGTAITPIADETLIIRVDLSAYSHVRPLMKEIQAQIDAAGAYVKRWPHDLDSLRGAPQLSSSSKLAPVLFCYSAPHTEVWGAEGLHTTFRVVESSSSQARSSEVEWILSLHSDPNGVACSLEYDQNIYVAESIDDFTSHLMMTLTRIVQDPNQLWKTASELPIDLRQRILEKWNATERNYPIDDLVHNLFEKQVKRTPAACALICGRDQLTYEELNQRSNRLAHYLREIGVVCESRVAICVERSLEMVVSLLAILKAGAAYIPLDPTYPADRLEFMLQDSSPVALLTQSHLASKFQNDSVTMIALDSEEYIDRSNGNSCENLFVNDLTCRSLMYVMYTSGSTGSPKGVMTEHRAVVNRMLWMLERHPLDSTDTILQKTPYGFDVSVWEFFWPLLCGARLLLAKPEGHKDPDYLADMIGEYGVSAAHFVPSMLRVFLDSASGQDCPALKTVFSGGEALTPLLVQRFQSRFPETQLYNLYGPTEAAVDVTAWPCPPYDDDRCIPIGFPVPNTRIYILDDELSPLPPGVAGELHIGGVQVARGYWNRDSLTAERFIVDPFWGGGKNRMYRTGDLARWLQNGAIEFLGRNDFQVKIHGQRIELGEIEKTLSRHEAVKDVVVLAQENAAGVQRLMAYWTPASDYGQSGKAYHVDDLREYLQRSLPDYMIPAEYVRLNNWPVTTNGKLDRHALSGMRSPDPYSPGDAPQGELESALARLWEEVLQVSGVGRNSDFVSLGGHSLSAMIIISRLRVQLGMDATVRDFFAWPTVASLSERLTRYPGRKRPGIDQTRSSGGILSFAQESLWSLSRTQDASRAYHISFGLSLQGHLDKSALRTALNELLLRHDVLRATFVDRDGEPLVEYLPDELCEFQLSECDLSSSVVELPRILAHESATGFDLNTGPLIRGLLAKRAEDDHVLIVTMHHIVSDGWSVGVLVDEFRVLYERGMRGNQITLPRMLHQFRDYARWQREQFEDGAYEESLRYWADHLKALPEQHDLPTDRTRPSVPSYVGDVVRRQLPVSLSASLDILSRGEGVSLFMTLLTAFQILLARWSGQDDVVVGTPVADRSFPGADSLVGLFVNMVALRTKIPHHESFRSLLKHVSEICLSAYRHQDVPFELVLQRLNPTRDMSRHPLFQIALNMLNYPRSPVAMSDLDVNYLEMPKDLTSKFDLTLYVRQGESLRLDLAYSTDLFDNGRMVEFLDQFQELLTQVAQSPDAPISGFSLVTANAMSRLPDPKQAIASGKYPSILTRFAEQVALKREAPAIFFSGRTITYAALDSSSSNLANELMERGLTGKLIAIYAARTPDLVECMLAVWKAKAHFVLLDRTHPEPLLRDYIALLDPAAILGGALDHTTPDKTLEVRASSDDLGMSFDSASPVAPSILKIEKAQMAYIALTSGSTGIPKIIVGTHGPLEHFADWYQTTYNISASDRFSMLSGLGHDPLLRDIFVPLTIGASISIPNDLPLGEDLARWLSATDTTVAHMTPSLARTLQGSQERLATLRLVACGGETLTYGDVQLLRTIAPKAELVNFYGTTETPQAACFYDCGPDRSPDRKVPIGSGISEVQALVVGDGNRLCGIGECGEILIRTTHLTDGYRNDIQETARRYISNPFRADLPDRIYRTGDLGRYNLDGAVEYVGRSDSQVKIRGFRVELRAVEATLEQISSVTRAAVVVREDNQGLQQLVGYVIPNVLAEFNADAIRHGLASRLPAYMVPVFIIPVDELPLTPNGKLDYQALPVPSFNTAHRRDPRTLHEELLANIFAEVLHLGSVDVHRSFFDLGGHSLSATRAVSRIRRLLGIELSIRTLFENSSVVALARRLDSSLTRREPVVPCPKRNAEAVSYGQRRLLFLQKLDTANTAYNLTLAFKIRGSLNTEALGQSILDLVTRHEPLRTVFLESEDGYVQAVLPVHDVRLQLAHTDVSVELLSDALSAEANRPFELTRQIPIRTRLFDIGPHEYALELVIHHVACDGWSMAPLIRDLEVAYSHRCRNEVPTWSPLPVQYLDFALWQQKLLGKEGNPDSPVAQQLSYWEATLTGLSEEIDLPYDKPRPPAPTYSGRVVEFDVPKRLHSELAAIARKYDVTLFMVLHAACALMVSRVANCDDIVFGTPTAGRTDDSLEDLVGFFVNTLVLRVSTSGNPTIVELLARTREVDIAAYANQDVPFDRLVEKINPSRVLGRHPLFQIMFVMQNTERAALTLPGLTVESIPVETGTAQFDLSISMREQKDEAGDLLGIHGRLTYATDLFESSTIERLARRFLLILDEIVKDPSQRIQQVDILSSDERDLLLHQWNGITTRPSTLTLPELFEQQALTMPRSTAVVTESEVATYADLNIRANQLAYLLIAGGVGPESLVAVSLHRSVELVVALLAVLKAGAAYVPLDPSYPTERLEFMLDDCSPRALITHSDVSNICSTRTNNLWAIDLSDPSLDLCNQPTSDPKHTNLSPRSLAYVMYTSGSTGKPKGVMIEQGSICNRLTWGQAAYPLTDSDCVMQKTPFSFDISVWELFWPLLYGAKLMMAEPNRHRDPAYLVRTIRKHNITVIHFVPSMLTAFLDAVDCQGLPTLRRVICSGEALSPSLAKRFNALLPETALENLYGPTEAAVEVTAWSYTPTYSGTTLPIGRPIANTMIYILDGEMRPVPVGTVGELHIGGIQVARGYWQRPQLTIQKFVPNPFSAKPDDRLYRTGDQARWLADGNIDFKGRSDTQVKLRGFRIELEEIEATLTRHQGVREAVVSPLFRDGEIIGLVAYFTCLANSEAQCTPESLRNHLRRDLPDFMIPAAYVRLESLPLSVTGKLDRKALPKPDGTAYVAKPYDPPKGLVEEALAQIWAGVLGSQSIGRNDNFFELGGHSLIATRVLFQVQRHFEIRVELRDTFECPTLSGFAALIRDRQLAQFDAGELAQLARTIPNS